MIKPRLYSEKEEDKIIVSTILNYVFGNILKLMHPFMPFITSEIYSKLICFDTDHIIISKWPETKTSFEFEDEEETIETLKKLIVEIRNVRTKMNVHPSKKSKLIIVKNNKEDKIKETEMFLTKLGFANEIVFQNENEEIPNNAVSIMVDNIKAFLPFEELVDIEEERKRLENEKTRLEAEVERASKMLSNPGFVNKAPESKIQEEKEKLKKYQEMLKNVEERLKM